MKNKKNPAIDQEVITQTQYRLVEALSTEARKAEMRVDHLREVVFETDAQGKLTFLNKAWLGMLGYDREKSLGCSVLEFVAVQDCDHYTQQLNRFKSNGNVCPRFEVRFKHQNGQFVWVELSIVSLENGGILGLMYDITEHRQDKKDLQDSKENLEIKVKERTLRLELANDDLCNKEKTLTSMLKQLQDTHEELKQAQMQLIQSEKLASIGQLAAGIAHEINNPVGFISNNLELIRGYSISYEKLLNLVEILKGVVKEKDISKANECVKQIIHLEEELNLKFIKESFKELLADSMEGVERVKKIVIDLRTFAHCDEEKIEEVQIDEIIDGVINIIWNEIKYNADLNKEYGKVPRIKGNPQKLGQVFMNLLLNASQAIKERGEIIVKTYCEGQYVCIDIKDTGSGISKENFGKVFDAFYTTKPVGKGKGLGLSVSYEIITKHDGKIIFDSEEGKGTTFTVKLPINREKIS
ncbi:Circadian input kinase A [hydrothermal vent metagenome]|uniref:Circadian input kinase A n=1 Tax=hydrothermal vent metagenome TaxID=652676 RepID=A0A3B1DIX4_9ZZZZ